MDQSSKPFNICEKRAEILNADEHMLVEGGPGSGKTTIALLKAKELIDKKSVGRGQKILFLSFARATVGRVEEQANNLITKEHKKLIEINTYHGFSWQIIQSYGYLLKKFRSLKFITPPNLTTKTTNLDKAQEDELKKSLLDDEGIVCFDLFCGLTADILSSSTKIRAIISDAYPYIIVDEFQDTDENEWRMIKLLGEKSKIFAMADLDQRIYDFRGASVTRIPEFNNHFSDLKFDLGKENNRSANTDIIQFGNDLLTGDNKDKEYTNVKVIKYPIVYGEPKLILKSSLSKSIERLKKGKPDGNWSVVVLVKSKQDTLQISSYLSTKTKLPQYFHEVLIDPAGPSLAATIIAQVLEPQDSSKDNLKLLTASIINHIKGRVKNKIAKSDLKLVQALEKYLAGETIKGKNRIQLISEIETILKKRNQMVLTGVPENDWLTIRKYFEESSHDVLKNIYMDAKYLRLLNKGATLSEMLSEMWRQYNQYMNATGLINEALTQEHFSMTTHLLSRKIQWIGNVVWKA